MIKDARMQYRAVFGTRSRYARLRNEGLYPSKAFAPMQYGHEIGHASANFALTEQWFMLTTAHFALQSNFQRKLVYVQGVLFRRKVLP